MITASLRAVGTGRSIVIDERNEVLAGNGVLEAAPGAGISKVRVVDVDGDTIVAVRRRGLTEAQKRDLAIYDNRAGELAEWNLTQLAADLEAGEDLAPFFFDDELVKMGLTQAADDGAAAAAVKIGQAGVIVLCADEAEQQKVYEDLLARGFKCKVVNT
jgi:hypothetical protein